jgi:hypothetical protein
MQPALNDPRFLAIRSLLVELAAALDRAERHATGQAAALDADQRWELILAAVDRLADGPGRAEALQILFSDPYEPTWRRDGGPQLAGSPGCCGR